jgi:hypothetical protein
MREDDERPGVLGDADAAYEAIRALNHATIWGGGIPAPTIYGVLANLKTALGYGAEQALNQLAARLVDSLYEFDATEYDGRSPTESVAAAVGDMRAAAHLAEQIGGHLSAAQSAIAGQGRRGPLEARASR